MFSKSLITAFAGGLLLTLGASVPLFADQGKFLGGAIENSRQNNRSDANGNSGSRFSGTTRSNEGFRSAPRTIPDNNRYDNGSDRGRFISQPRVTRPEAGSRNSLSSGDVNRQKQGRFIGGAIDNRVPYPDGYRYDNRHRHNRYYPPRGYVFGGYPHYHRAIPYRGTTFFFYSGIWYQPYGSSYIVVQPPIGLLTPVLPSYHTTIWIQGQSYYYADNVYYRWRPTYERYEVVTPPAGEITVGQTTDNDELFIYPKEGQDEAQQTADRFECHVWANEQTGFDPTRPAGAVSNTDYNGKRSDYQRAMKACLEGRGYSIS